MRIRRSGVSALGLVLTLGFGSFAAVDASATVAPVSTCAVLGQGSIGPAVVSVQKLVRTTPDGGFGPLTAAALKKWQTRHHVPATGVVDAATWAAFPTNVAQTACAQQVHGTGVSATCARLATGATGPAVAVLQKALAVTADGDFGPLTAAAVRTAQTKAKLKPTGVVGPATWASLGLTGTPACTDATPIPTPTPTPTPQPPADSKQQKVIRDQVVKLAAALLDAPGTSTNPVALKAMQFAQAQTGKPYKWAGVGPKAYDCSGLTMTSYLHAGITLPRVAADQYGAGQVVPLDEAQQGDLLFYASDVMKPATIYHVVMYVGAGNILDAPYTGAFVGTRALWTRDLLPVAIRPVGQLTLPVRPGATGWTVEQLQMQLDRHGAGLTVDGGYGPSTVTAVKAWKVAHHLTTNAIVGQKMWLTFG